MATIAKLVEGYTAPGRIDCQYISTFGNADDGVPIRLTNVESLRVEVSGTAAGATMTIEGSMDGVTYGVLHDDDGTDLTFAAATIPRVEDVRECSMPFIRPRTSGGAGTGMTVRFIAQQGPRA